jgi:hypothetical protein
LKVDAAFEEIAEMGYTGQLHYRWDRYFVSFSGLK